MAVVARMIDTTEALSVIPEDSLIHPKLSSDKYKFLQDAGMSKTQQMYVGLTLAGLLYTSWTIIHVYCLFYFSLDTLAHKLIAPVFILLQTWICCGIFIVSHDAMHGNLAPGKPRINFLVGQLSLTIFAFFSFRRMAKEHARHHHYSGTTRDPDFHHKDEEFGVYGIAAWLVRFFAYYFRFSQFLLMTVQTQLYFRLFGVSPWNVALFWAIPMFGASYNMFYFGTVLVHRPDPKLIRKTNVGDDFDYNGFEDRHRARSLDYPPWLSLLTCFHFGYHIEHHNAPKVPWWGLPRVRRHYLAQRRKMETERLN